MIVRQLLALAAIAVVVLLGTRLADHRACEDARRDVFGSLTGKAQRDPGDLRTIEDRCRGTEALVATAGALRTAGDTTEAERLAREATEREPESFAAWRALATLTRDREAVRRAGALNPRWAQARAAGAAEGP